MKDVSDLIDSDYREGPRKVHHATGTHIKERGHSGHQEHEDRPHLHPTDANGDSDLPVEPDVRPDHGRG